VKNQRSVGLIDADNVREIFSLDLLELCGSRTVAPFVAPTARRRNNIGVLRTSVGRIWGAGADKSPLLLQEPDGKLLVVMATRTLVHDTVVLQGKLREHIKDSPYVLFKVLRGCDVVDAESKSGVRLLGDDEVDNREAQRVDIHAARKIGCKSEHGLIASGNGVDNGTARCTGDIKCGTDRCTGDTDGSSDHLCAPPQTQ
jgi:hypothetical protein